MGALTDVEWENCGKPSLKSQRLVDLSIERGRADVDGNLIFDLYPEEQVF
jgi:hypothetical protein